jgi:hypothetical protein
MFFVIQVHIFIAYVLALSEEKTRPTNASYEDGDNMGLNYMFRLIFLSLAFLGVSAALTQINKQDAFASSTTSTEQTGKYAQTSEIGQRALYLKRFRKARNRRERRLIRVRSFSFFDSVQRKAIPEFTRMNIADGVTIDLANLPTQNLNVRADVKSRFVKSVRFFINAQRVNDSNKRPHRMLENGRRQKKLPPKIWIPTEGEYVIRAIPFSEPKRRGIRGQRAEFRVNVINSVGPDEPTYVPDPDAPELAGLSEWEENMTQYGALHCDPDVIEQLQTYEGSVWNYDGLSIYYQIAGWTENSAWETCAGYVKELYRGYVLENQGNIPGWRVFTDGLYSDFLRNQEAESRQAIIMLATKSSFSHLNGGESYEVSVETANLLSALITAEKVGEPLRQNVNSAADYALGHLQQWIDGTADYVHPYRMGITMRALITYYERTEDARVVPAIQQASNWLWQNMYDPTTKSFPFVVCRNGFDDALCDDDDLPAPDLNMLIAPAYAWLWHKDVDDAQNLNRADLLFTGGLEGHFLGSGKHFSQSYVYAFDFMNWRLGVKDPL